MVKLDTFIETVAAEFPGDRLTWQKGIATFHPESAEEAAALFKLANQKNHPLYITGFGNNIDPVGEPFNAMLSVRTDRLNRFIEVAAQDFAVTVGAGYPLRELNHRLKQDDLYLPHAALPYTGSIGGALAVGLCAELHGHDVPIKKYFVKAEIVTPEGDIITPGSACFKSVSGYDIVKIFSGSWGLLGLIVTATFRVMPLSGADDFVTMCQKGIDRKSFLDGLSESGNETDIIYSRKIKEKFDPAGILPVTP